MTIACTVNAIRGWDHHTLLTSAGDTPIGDLVPGATTVEGSDLYEQRIDNLREARRATEAGDTAAREAALALVQTMPDGYGVADSIEQVIERIPWLSESEREFVLIWGEITRVDDPGWRWHKHGEYIGDHEPQREHLGDEPVIERVIAWEALEVGREPQPADCHVCAIGDHIAEHKAAGTLSQNPDTCPRCVELSSVAAR